MQILLPGAAAMDPDQLGLFDESEVNPDAGRRHVGLSMATIDSRVAVAEASRGVLARTFVPRQPGGVKIPLFLPQVVTRWERDPFSLAQVNLTSVEELGRAFANDNAPTLTRKAIDARRDEGGQARIVITDQTEQVLASQTAMPFDTIETDLVGRLMRTNGIEASVREMNAAIGVAQAFLRGAGVLAETPWRPEHGARIVPC